MEYFVFNMAEAKPTIIEGDFIFMVNAFETVSISKEQNENLLDNE